MTYDIQDTRSLTAPYVGTVRFGLTLTGTIRATNMQYLGSQTNATVPVEYRGRGEGTYSYREGAWAFEELKYIVDAIDAGREIDPSKDMASALFANQIQNLAKPTFGQPAAFPSAKYSELVKLLREAAIERP